MTCAPVDDLEDYWAEIRPSDRPVCCRKAAHCWRCGLQVCHTHGGRLLQTLGWLCRGCRQDFYAFAEDGDINDFKKTYPATNPNTGEPFKW